MSWYTLVGNVLTIIGCRSIEVRTADMFIGPLSPHMVGHEVWHDPIYTPSRRIAVNVAPPGYPSDIRVYGDLEWVGDFTPAPLWGGNCWRWWEPEMVQPGQPWTRLETDVPIATISGNITITLPRHNRWVITAQFCPQHYPHATETLVVDLFCPADMSQDGAVNVEDILIFLAGFEAGDIPVADLDQNGGVDISDLLYFLSRYEEGC